MANLGVFAQVESSKATQVSVPPSSIKYLHVKGTLKVGGSLADRRVVLLDRRTLAYVSSCYSHVDGSFEFKGLPAQGFLDYYVVLAFDDLRMYNAEAIDFVKQVETAGGI